MHYPRVKSLLLLSAALPAFAACPNDLTEPSSDTESSSSSGEVSTSGGDVTSGADNTGPGDSETGSADTTGGEPPDPPPATAVNCSQIHAPLVNMDVAERSVVVDEPSLCDGLTNASSQFTMWVWEPEDPGTNERVTDGRPWVLLQHGAGQQATEYRHLVDELVGAGFVVFGPAVAPPAGNAGGLLAATTSYVR